MPFRSVETLTAAAASPQTFTMPAGVADGDFLLWLVLKSNIAGTVNTPAGWTQLRGDDSIPQGSFNNNEAELFYRWASSEPATYDVTCSANGAYGGFIAAYSGMDQTSTPAISTHVEDRLSPSGNTPSSTVPAAADGGVDETLMYVMYGQGTNSVYSGSMDAGTTPRVGMRLTTPSNRIFMALADEEYTTSGNYPARTFSFTWSTAGEVGICASRIYGVRPEASFSDRWGWADNVDFGTNVTYNHASLDYNDPYTTYNGGATGRDPGAWDVV